MGEELLTKPEQTQVTRKKLLKRAGVGALAVWTLPMVGASPAWAQAARENRCLEQARARGRACQHACQELSDVCSADGCCGCVVLTNGCCECIDFCQILGCAEGLPCAKNRDCPRGTRCIDAFCCGGAPGRCLPICRRPAGAGAARGGPPLQR